MIDFNVLYAVLVAVALVLLIRFVFPLYKDREDVYKDVKQGLLLFGYAFRDDKVKQITNMILRIVEVVEQMDMTASNKKEEAVYIAYNQLIDTFNIELDEGALELIVNIAVTQLPPTNNPMLDLRDKEDY